MGQKQVCHMAGQRGEDSFKLGMTRDWDDNVQSSNKVVGQFGKEMVQGDV